MEFRENVTPEVAILDNLEKLLMFLGNFSCFGMTFARNLVVFGVTFHGSRLPFHAPGTPWEGTGYSKWLKTIVCAMYFKVFG